MEARADEVKKSLQALAKTENIVKQERFFKTKPGEYGHGDEFIGVKVPQIRSVVRHAGWCSSDEVIKLLESPIHEHRFAGVLFLINKFSHASKKRSFNEKARKHYYLFYLDVLNRGCINNWDLVDVSAGPILGEYLHDRSRDVLDDMVRSSSIWVRRAAMVSTQVYMKHGDGSTTLRLARVLLDDEEDLIQKAVGWMLRTMGQDVDPDLLFSFLDAHAHEMPRTMLRYSLEHVHEAQRKKYLMLRDKQGTQARS